MDRPQLSVLHHSLIPPVSPAPRESLFLSALDAAFRGFYYNRKILFFRVCPEDYSSLIDTLKRSLSRVLVDFYPLAGRLREGDGGRLEVACNDLGVEFVEAVVNGVSFSEMESENFDLKPFFDMFTQWGTYSAKDENYAPVLSIQVTRFNCGNIAMGIAHSHVVADGQSLWHFMVSWAECARGLPISITPVHERTLLRVEKSEKTVILEPENIEDVIEGSPESGKAKVFEFSKAMVTRLKQTAGGERITTYEALCAHIWRCASRARGHAMEAKLGFTTIVNTRRKMDPQLPDNYFGNAVMWVMATATMRELEEEDLTTTAMRIKASKDLSTSSSMKGFLHSCELYGRDVVVKWMRLNRARLRASSSPKFPIYEVDFGWGKPVGVRSVKVEDLGKIVLYEGGEGEGSVDVCIALPTVVMEKLQTDSTFTQSLRSPPP